MNIFVYGTLKRKCGNNGYLKDSKFIGAFLTTARYSLYLADGGLPFLSERGLDKIKGEIYRVDRETLKRVDALEGHPYFYKRKPIDIIGFDEPVEAYFCETSMGSFMKRITDYPCSTWNTGSNNKKLWQDTE